MDVFRPASIVAVALGLTMGPGPADGRSSREMFRTAHPDPAMALSTVWSVDGARPGDHIVLAIIADIPDGWHINPDEGQIVSGDEMAPVATRIEIMDAQGVMPETVRYPDALGIAVQDVDEGALQSFAGRVVFFVPMKVEHKLTGLNVGVTVHLHYQMCDDINCLMPETIPATAVLPIVSAGSVVEETDPRLFAAFHDTVSAVRFDVFGWQFLVDSASRSGLMLLLLTALAGGVLLNFTPCVLPVIPIKILSLSQVAENKARCVALGGAMSIGVVVFWLVLGLLISGVSGFSATNQLFQYPLFTITVGVIIAIMAVGMCGLFTVRLPDIVQRYTPQQGTLVGSCGMGVMTAVLSTPCTAPFMGAAAAWAALQNPVTTVSIFGVIGAGMALPYMVLSIAPGLLSRLPRSGPGSQLLKEVMGLLLLAAAMYFMGTGIGALCVTPPDPPSTLYWWPVMGLCAVAGVWITYRTWGITQSRIKRVVWASTGLALCAMSLQVGRTMTDRGPINWTYYTAERFELVRNEGQAVLMDFTAEWCLNCKAIEHSVLHHDDVVAALESGGIVPMKVDITGHNPEGKSQLAREGRLAIPLLVIYGHDGTPVMKSDFYTVDQVIKAISQATCPIPGQCG